MLKIPFFRLGTWKHPAYGQIEGNPQMFREMIQNFKSNVLGRPPFVRIGHDKATAPQFGNAESLGWVKDIVEEDGVLYGLADPTSSEVAGLIRNKKYLFASAEYTPNYVDKETGLFKGVVLTAISLTNEPFLTKLPEAVVLSEQLDLFYMDYALADSTKEGEDLRMSDENKNFFQKITDILSGFTKKQEEVQVSTNTQLADMNKQMQEQKLLAEKQVTYYENQAKEAEKARCLAEVEKDSAAMVAFGIPPVMVEQWKQLALSEQGTAAVKLSDGTEISTAQSMKNMLLTMPEDCRVKMGQQGSQGQAGEAEKMVLATREDVIAMGGTVTTDGKFII